ncbi:MAG: sulfatase-like hydrolase/transferase [Chloroflexi bacterium]|nr:sulfatase-like hydrolase/transferase [Chloroflexota bacterium]
MSVDTRPNLLIFMNDQQQGQVNEPGHPCRTPHADRLAAEGVRFARAYTTTAHCCPSRATFMTGLYPSRHGIYNNVLNDAALSRSLKPGVVTFSEVLRDAGYELAFSGKWHVCADEQPQDRGWNQYHATAIQGEMHGLRWERFRELAHQPEPDAPRGRGELLRPGWGRYRLYGTREPAPETDPYLPGDLRTVEIGIRALQDLARQEKPWCLYIGPVGPHDPYILPEHYATMYDPAEVELPPSYYDDLMDKPRVYQRQRRFWGQMTEEEYREAIAHYWGFCSMQDDLLGMVMEALEATGQAENTFLLFISDHGDYAGAHGLFMKGVAAFDECYRVPCIMRWPAGIAEPGRTVEEFVTLADLAPTFAELAGTALPAQSGRSLLPFLRGERPEDWPDELCSQFNGVELYYSQRFVQTREWKYVYNGFDFDELYHLSEDPHCLRNLAGDLRYRPVIEEMCRRMWRKGYEEGDIFCNPYPTVSLAPFGPMVGLREGDEL